MVHFNEISFSRIETGAEDMFNSEATYMDKQTSTKNAQLTSACVEINSLRFTKSMRIFEKNIRMIQIKLGYMITERQKVKKIGNNCFDNSVEL